MVAQTLRESQKEAAKCLYPRRSTGRKGRDGPGGGGASKGHKPRRGRTTPAPARGEGANSVDATRPGIYGDLTELRSAGANSPIYASFDPAKAPINPSGFKGQKLPKTLSYDGSAGLQDLCSEGFEVIPWDGRTYRPIVDKKTGLVIGALAGRPSHSSWNASVERMNALLESERKRMEALLPSGAGQSTRGPFIAVNGGYSHGGGRSQPTVCKNSDLPQHVVGPAIQRVVSDGDFNELASFMSAAFRRTAPAMYRHYTDVTEAIEERIDTLKKPFESGVYPTLTVNFGPKVVTLPHRDSENLPWAFCGIASLGHFDHSKGGHLVLWELRLVVEFPPGSVILIPSALISHSNLALPGNEDERRYSFTQYAAGDLFRWVANGFSTHKDLFPDSGDPSKLNQRKVEQHYSKMRYAAKLRRMLPSIYKSTSS